MNLIECLKLKLKYNSNKMQINKYAGARFIDVYCKAFGKMKEDETFMIWNESFEGLKNVMSWM